MNRDPVTKEETTKRYMGPAKQLKEILHWTMDPMKTLGSKASPFVRWAVAQGSKAELGSGFPTDFQKDSFWKSLPKRTVRTAEVFVPFSLTSYVTGNKSGQFLFAIPTRQGMTNYTTVEHFKKVLKEKPSKERVEKISWVLRSSLENNLNGFRLLMRANQAVKGESTYQYKDLARELFNEIKLLDPTAKIDATEVYKKRGWLIPEVLKEYKKLIKNEMEVKVQKELLGIGKKKSSKKKSIKKKKENIFDELAAEKKGER
jgi:hypothetical protein